MPKRCEYQFRADWDFNPGLWSLSFATKMNLGVSMSLKRALRRSGWTDGNDRAIGEAAAHLYRLLWDGEYIDYGGRRQKVHGDIPKVSRIVGLSATQKALLQITSSCLLESQAHAKSEVAFAI